ncbi:MAG TPA: hypothetical protein VE863_22685 [Pyrinomonadaceae bacterium]|jgi:hypothetical protein|nr:hypothetical protein [Pyrinomonadaceae bacterium]
MSAYLRYGNLITIDKEDAVSTLTYRLSALLNVRDQTDQAREVRLDIGWGAHQHWTVLDREGRASAQRVKFGDTISLAVHKFGKGGYIESDNSPWYLSVRDRFSLEGGDKPVATMPQISPSEQWQIINPNDASSTQEVKFGDTIVLRSPSVAGRSFSSIREKTVVSTRPEQYAKWVIREVPVDLVASDLNSLSLYKVPDRADKMALLSVGFTVQGIVSKVAGKIPKVGDVLGPLIEFLWPPDGEDVWALVKDQVQALVDDAIFKSNVENFEARLEGIKTTLKGYYELEGLLEKGMQLIVAIGKLDDLKAAAGNLKRPEQTLTYLVTLGTLHIAALSELCTHGAEMFASKASEYPQKDRIKHQTDFKKALGDYSKAVKMAKEKAIEWRLTKLRIKTTLLPRESSHDHTSRYEIELLDDYTGRNHGTWNSPSQAALNAESAKAKAALEKLKERIRTEFEGVLAPVLMPSFVWPFMDPDSQEIPLRTTATVVTGPHGGKGGNGFDDDSKGQPLTGFELNFGEYDRVYIVKGARFKYGDEWGPWHGVAGGSITEILQPGEVIVKAHGKAAKFLDAVYFTTNKNRVLGGGGTGGHDWEVSLPAGAEPALLKISGSKGDILDSIMPQWRYSRWE